ncbi:MAG TPA: ribosome small subunit-dependent GTPase A, partial [Candidatus Atribacteria bacterium]|nr:ribosome small subunit-dependent GTPase A [Candidatus Atribacteria bacterium]
MMTGIILKAVGGFYDVFSDGRVIRCRARGKFRKDGVIPVVGDHVEINPGSNVQEGTIENILDRRNFLGRPAVANVDNLIVILAAASPEPDLLLTDKLLISAEYKGIQPIIVINKTDLADSARIEALVGEFRNTGYPCHAISAKHNLGLEALVKSIKGITALAGQSGVGKSSVINRLCPKLQLETGDLSVKIQRGRHTTRHVELIILDEGGMIIDTPGFSQLDLNELQPEQLQEFYPDFKPFRDKCRFTGCMHLNEPDCAVKEAFAEGEISEGRYS